ncbi:MAG TPA: PepSY-associated TM helix domain-containing protein [Polyangiaceae bacterium]|nr:PepSY-associated TM helix domain-containing protein [Polyangiaceae bacterium]
MSRFKVKRLSRLHLRPFHHYALVWHRYVGLGLAALLVVVGLTGSLLAFQHELDVALNPELWRAIPEPGARLLEPFELSERVQRQLPSGLSHGSVQFELVPGEARPFWVESAPGRWEQHFANPYTGELLGSRRWGDIAEGKRNLVPFLYRLHYALALDGFGQWLLGIAALLWSLDCFVGAYLTFPVRSPGAGSRSPVGWLRRWFPAWLVRTSKPFAMVFTGHRAAGLWLWGMLFVFAWSAVGLNLPHVYRPVTRAVFGLEPNVHDQLPQLAAPFPKPGLSLQVAHARARELMAQAAEQRAFRIQREVSLQYLADHGAFMYRVQSTLDISATRPRTEVYFDGRSGKPLGFNAALGPTAGNTLTSWLYALHFSEVGGLPYRLFVTCVGAVVAALSASGAWIWWVKRRKRTRARSLVREGTAAAPVLVNARARPHIDSGRLDQEEA